jgi:SAM-dependent methyltransferase
VTGDSPTFRGRLNAWCLAHAEDEMDRLYGTRKSALFASLPELVLEIGPGAGANLRYYRAGTRVIAVEPSMTMRERLGQRAAGTDAEVVIVDAVAERLPLCDASVGAVVSTLVMCSVADPEEVLAEIRRVLEPGGRFHFIEHVAAAEGTWLRRAQGAFRGPWRWLAEGCTLDRTTGEMVERAGFTRVEYERFRMPIWFALASPHVAGSAVR